MEFPPLRPSPRDPAPDAGAAIAKASRRMLGRCGDKIVLPRSATRGTGICADMAANSRGRAGRAGGQGPLGRRRPGAVAADRDAARPTRDICGLTEDLGQILYIGPEERRAQCKGEPGGPHG